MRTARDGTEYGADELDPLVAPESTHLLRGPAHRQAIAALDQFLAAHAEKEVRDPLRRALLQRDLWAVFEPWAVPSANDPGAARGLRRPTRELQGRLARVIHRLALPADQIRALPDTYAAAIASGVYQRRHEPAKPETPFLPSFAADGWVLLEDRGGSLAAPDHAGTFNGHSVFLVYLRLPHGRRATLDCLDKLHRFPKPQVVTKDGSHTLNPDLPQFPAGTQVALVRRMVLIDDQGSLRPTRITESVQFRVYRDVPKMGTAPPFATSRQDFYEFKLRRKDLFAGKAGGLHAVGPDEQIYKDAFQRTRIIRGPDEDSAAPARAHEDGGSSLQFCASCHAAACHGPGIFSVLSFAQRSSPGDLGPAEREARDGSAEEQRTIGRKRSKYSWGLFEGMWEAEPAK
jgi:hypothetical protein